MQGILDHSPLLVATCSLLLMFGAFWTSCSHLATFPINRSADGLLVLDLGTALNMAIDAADHASPHQISLHSKATVDRRISNSISPGQIPLPPYPTDYPSI